MKPLQKATVDKLEGNYSKCQLQSSYINCPTGSQRASGGGLTAIGAHVITAQISKEPQDWEQVKTPVMSSPVQNCVLWQEKHRVATELKAEKTNFSL